MSCFWQNILSDNQVPQNRAVVDNLGFHFPSVCCKSAGKVGNWCYVYFRETTNKTAVSDGVRSILKPYVASRRFVFEQDDNINN